MTYQTKKVRMGERDWTVRSDKPGDRAAIDEVFIKDCYHILNIELREKPCILDVGAHIGSFSILAYQTFKHLNPIIAAYEPNSETFERLEQNVANLPISINKKGIRHDGANCLTDFKMSTLGSKVVKKGTSGGDYPIMYEIETTTIAEAMLSHGMDRLDLVKLDCELSEHDILPVLSKMKDRVGHIIGEWHAMKFKEFDAGLRSMFEGRTITTVPYESNDTMGIFSISSS